ncbi:MAG: M20/M25/M40 family metallo-hydrolase [Bryobacteraceae bacterium]
MLNVDCDTVDVAGMAKPLSGAIRDGKLHGCGAFDMKCSRAACMAAMKALVDEGARLRGDLLAFI